MLIKQVTFGHKDYDNEIGVAIALENGARHSIFFPCTNIDKDQFRESLTRVASKLYEFIEKQEQL